MNNKENLYRFPSKDEYLYNKHNVQINELKSERFKSICETLSVNYWSLFVKLYQLIIGVDLEPL